MEITEVRVTLRLREEGRLRASATVTFDNCFVVRDIKVIEGEKGLFVAMPSRKMQETCPKCRHKNVVRSKFCNYCGSGLEVRVKPPSAQEGEFQSEHRDIAHPITAETREYLQKKVLQAYEAEKKKEPPKERASVEPPKRF